MVKASAGSLEAPAGIGRQRERPPVVGCRYGYNDYILDKLLCFQCYCQTAVQYARLDIAVVAASLTPC
jgi:hypothetical protein